MTALVDDLGTWFQMGAVAPTFGEWTQFPVTSSTGRNTFRVSFAVNDFLKVKSICYLRIGYTQGGAKVVDRQWLKLYPKPEPEIINFNSLPYFHTENPFRFIEIQKRAKYKKLGYTIYDELYAVNLEEFIPLPDTINTLPNLSAIQLVLDAQLTDLQTQLTQDLAQQIVSTVNDVVTQLEEQEQLLTEIAVLLLGGI